MDGKLAIGAAAVLPAALAAAGGFALGYARGRENTLGIVWNLRGLAQCLDPTVPEGGDPSDDRVEPYPQPLGLEEQPERREARGTLGDRRGGELGTAAAALSGAQRR